MERHEEDTLQAVAARVKALEDGHRALREEMADNTRTTKAIKSDTAALVEFARGYKATKLVGGWLAKFLAWAAPIAAAIAAIVLVKK